MSHIGRSLQKQPPAMSPTNELHFNDHKYEVLSKDSYRITWLYSNKNN